MANYEELKGLLEKSRWMLLKLTHDTKRSVAKRAEDRKESEALVDDITEALKRPDDA